MPSGVSGMEEILSVAFSGCLRESVVFPNIPPPCIYVVVIFDQSISVQTVAIKAQVVNSKAKLRLS